VNGNAYLLGASRKRFLGAAIGDNSLEFKQRDYATVAVNTVGILGGADILRVHNVKAAVQAALVTNKIIKKDN
ncbi:MAG: dihydropteroate synthase, partial [Clostridia bacterium]|nr:dihydropteroate synthase [Clostridia bacterium]